MKVKYSGVSEITKFCIATIIKRIWNILGIFIPLDRKLIVFDSLKGKQYSCNPRALYEYMLDNFPKDVHYVWAFEDPSKYEFLTNNNNTSVVKYRSFKHQYYSFKAETLIFNLKRTNEMPERLSKQIRIQTWHGGGCYKKTGKAIGYATKVHKWILDCQAKQMTHFVSSSDFFSENVIREQYAFTGTILKTGMPRNDIYFNAEKCKRTNQNIRKQLGIAPETFVVLYAPTFRDINGIDFQQLDYSIIKQALHEKYNLEIITLYRGHHYDPIDKKFEADLDVSGYYDMQDLIVMVDMLVTDYSSSIWDFSYTRKPCLLYTPDLAEYERYRGFDRNIYSWGFPVCENMDKLVEMIDLFDISIHEKSMKKHHEDLGSYEIGNATFTICEFIKNNIEN